MIFRVEDVLLSSANNAELDLPGCMDGKSKRLRAAMAIAKIDFAT